MNPRLLKGTAWSALGVALAVAVLFMWVDRPVDAAARGLSGGPWFAAAQSLSLIADHGWYNLWLAVALLLGGGLALGRGMTPGVRALLYVCVSVAAAMLVGEVLKWLFGRYRPVMLFEHAQYGFSWLADKGKMHSFPSGHTMRIFSAMTALALVWRRGCWACLALAVAVGISRVLVTRHYPSDVLAGAFVGVFAALWVWSIMGMDKKGMGQGEGAGKAAPPARE